MQTFDDFLDMLDQAQEKGWASKQVCSMHAGVPTTEAEDEAFEEGYDPCAIVVRIWGPEGKDGS